MAQEKLGDKTYKNTTDKVRDASKTYYIISGWNEQRKATACSSADFNSDGSFRSMHDDYWYDTWNFANTKEQGLRYGIEGVTEVDATDYGYMYKEEVPEEEKEEEEEEKEDSKDNGNKQGGCGGGGCGGGKAVKQDDLCGGGNCCSGEGAQNCEVSPECESETIAKAAKTLAQAMATQCLNVDTNNLVALVTAIPDPSADVCNAAKAMADGIFKSAKTAAKGVCTGCKSKAQADIAKATAAAIGDAAPLAAVTADLASQVQTLSGLVEGLTAP